MMKAGQRFSFVVDRTIAGRMDRVIGMHDGSVVHKKNGPGGTVYEVERT